MSDGPSLLLYSKQSYSLTKIERFPKEIETTNTTF